MTLHMSLMLSARGARLSLLSRCIVMVVNSLMMCIVSGKQLTSGLAGISMTLFLQHLAVFGVVVNPDSRQDNW